MGELAPHVVSSDSPVDVVLLLLAESGSLDSSQVSSDITPVRSGRESLLLMDWSGSPGNPHHLHKS